MMAAMEDVRAVEGPGVHTHTNTRYAQRTKSCWDDPIKYEMCWASGTNGGEESCVQGFGGET